MFNAINKFQNPDGVDNMNYLENMNYQNGLKKW